MAPLLLPQAAVAGARPAASAHSPGAKALNDRAADLVVLPTTVEAVVEGTCADGTTERLVESIRDDRRAGS
jgi:hypothetical protein